MFKNENKGIVFKARWFVRLDITRATGMTIILREMTRAVPLSYHLNNGRPRVSSRTNHLAVKTIPLFSK